ncbi:MAG TPA: ComF family protein [Acidobacteriaceae bacterium]|nr:ComF family protein [Acidobacteriaceae bacterium]
MYQRRVAFAHSHSVLAFAPRAGLYCNQRRGRSGLERRVGRCIFSVRLNESTLQQYPGAPLVPAGPDKSRAAAIMRRTHSALRSVLDDLVTTTFPADCRVCERPLTRFSRIPVCDSCRASIAPQTAALCARCGEALDVDLESVRFAAPEEGLECFACRAVPPMFERAVAYAAYEDELRELVHLLKYERMGSVADLLGAHLAEAVLALREQAARELIVIAVPLFPSKQRQRGYNQSVLLADAAIKHLRTLAPDWTLRRIDGVLTRRRDTRSQFELNPRSRRRNLEGAFAADAAKLTPGCEVLLVDDIYTTGATARECSRVLRRAGAGKVWVATLARAQKPTVAMWDGGRTAA